MTNGCLKSCKRSDASRTQANPGSSVAHAMTGMTPRISLAVRGTDSVCDAHPRAVRRLRLIGSQARHVSAHRLPSRAMPATRQGCRSR